MERRERGPRVMTDEEDEYLHPAKMSAGLWAFRFFCFLKHVKKLKTVKTAPGNSPEGKANSLCREELRVQHVQPFREEMQRQHDYRVQIPLWGEKYKVFNFQEKGMAGQMAFRL